MADTTTHTQEDQGMNMASRRTALGSTTALLAITTMWSSQSAAIVVHAYSRPIYPPSCNAARNLDPANLTSSFPVHQAIFNYLSHPTVSKKQFRCSGDKVEYIGVREEDRIVVTSTYSSNDRPFAEVVYLRVNNDYVRHGVTTAYWRSGTLRALEYHCDGFPVGFHRYFDRSGKLDTVVDYTKSDYAHSHFVEPTRYFTMFGQTLRSTPDSYEHATRFREIFKLTNHQAIRVGFAVQASLNSWTAVDLASTVQDWVTPGLTATISISKDPWQIQNNAWSYTSFSEIYQRQQQGATPPLPLRYPNKLLLSCPWIDQAMELGTVDGPFKFLPPDDYWERSTARAAERKYRSCISNPDVGCLLHSATFLAGNLPENLGGNVVDLDLLERLMSNPATAKRTLEAEPELTPEQIERDQGRFRMGLENAATMLQRTLSTSSAYSLALSAEEACRGGDVPRGHLSLDQARTMTTGNSPADLAYIAFAQAACDGPEVATAIFREALYKADKLIDPESDEIGESRRDTARSLIANQMLDAGIFDDLPTPSSRDRNSFQLRLAVAEARHGRPDEALRALESIRLTQTTVSPSFLFQQALASAEVYAVAKQFTESKTWLTKATRLAVTEDVFAEKLNMLTQLGELRIRIGDRNGLADVVEHACTAIDGAYAARDRWSAYNLEKALPDFMQLLPRIGESFARCGGEDTVVHDGQDRFHAESGSSKADKGDAVGSLDELQRIGSLAKRVIGLERVAHQADKFAQPHQRRYRQMVTDAALQVERAFSSSINSTERRRLVHAYTELLDSPLTNLDKAGRLAVLNSLRYETAWIQSPSQQARANCELAYTFVHFNISTTEDPWPTENAIISDGHTWPRPFGACAYWMQKAGRLKEAAQLMDQAYKGIRIDLNAEMPANTRSRKDWLVELAMQQFEYEHGEVFSPDWARATNL